MGALLARVKPEEPFGFPVSGASHQKHVLAGGSNLSQLIKGQTLSLCFGYPGPGLGGELEGANSDSLRNGEEPVVVGDGANNGDDAAIELGLALGGGAGIAGENADDPGDGERVSVEPGLVKSLVDDLVELGVSPAIEE